MPENWGKHCSPSASYIFQFDKVVQGQPGARNVTEIRTTSPGRASGEGTARVSGMRLASSSALRDPSASRLGPQPGTK